MGLTPQQKNRSNYTRLDRLLFYTGLAVLALAIPVVVGQISRGVPLLGEERRVLVFTQWWQDELAPGVLPALIREFEAQNPGVRITLDTRPYHEVRRLLLQDLPQKDGEDGRKEKGGTSAAAAGFPDILGLDPRWLPALAGGDMLEPVSAQEGHVLFRTADGEAQSAISRAWPVTFCVIPLFYRTDLLREAGFDRPPKNQAEFTAAARAVTDPSRGRYGFALSLSPEDPLGVYRDVFPWFRSSGAALIRNGRPAFTETPAANTLRFLNALSQEGLLAPEAFTKTSKDRLEDFAAGRLAMMLAPAVEIRNLRAAGVPFGVTGIPGPASYIGKPAVGVAGWYAGVSRSGKYKDEARAFISFLAEKADGVALQTGMIPEANTIPETGADFSPEQDAIYLKISDIYAAAGTTEEYLSLPAEMVLETILREELRLMFEEGRTPDETVRAVQKQWEAAL
ncbi:MAG: extracellular solute-binding protein [Treponema sp.]|jgi:multiple sugar transport system substrate-binding protein|nr:extracellular solute-binding protein [Treponema sp.]